MLARCGSSTIGAVIIAVIAGPVSWYLCHGPEPIVSPGLVWPLFFFVPAAVVGVVLGVLHGDGRCTGACFAGSIIVVHITLASLRAPFFCDSDIGCFGPAVISIAVFNVFGLIGLAYGCHIHSVLFRKRSETV